MIANRIFLAGLLAVGMSSAWAANSGFGGFQQDSKVPIEIAADSLEVSQDQGLAVFSGNVEAVQGALVLKAQDLKVSYRSGGNTTGADAAGTISRLRADGQVVIASPSENASGDWADYNVDKGIIRMGDTVVLTRGANVLKGKTLNIDLNTGLSRIDGAGNGGRVKGIFTPGSN